MGKIKLKKRKRSSSESSSTSGSGSSSSNSDSVSSKEMRKLLKLKKKLKKEQRKTEKALKKKLKKEKHRLKRKIRSRSKNHSETSQPTIEKSNDIPIELMEKSKAMAPMTKEEWEKRQSVVRRVVDEETGRQRLIKGDGEVLEEIVSRDRHMAINKLATRADGDFFQAQTAGKSRGL